MNYFAYSAGHSISRVIEVYEVVQQLKGYAISIYKGLWEEALNKSFFHILDNYDENSGNDLEHYATRVVGTILLNKYNKEYENETALTTALDSKSISETGTNPIEILMTNEDEAEKAKVSLDIEDCKEYLMPMFIEDYKFFKTRKSSMRSLSYEGLFGKFSESTVMTAMDELCEEYGSLMDELVDYGKESNFRSFSEDRYKKSMDDTVVLKSRINGVLLYEKKTARSSKKFFYVGLSRFIDGLIQVFYDSGRYSRKLGNYTAYCSLSGVLCCSKEKLRECLECELVGCILARLSVKVVKYNKGESMILSSSKYIESIQIPMFGECMELCFSQLLAKCVNK